VTDTARLGVVGLGWWGTVLTNAAGQSGRAEVVGCFARSQDAREAFAAAHDCRPFDSYEAMLADGEIDGVVIATPHSTHANLIEAAAAAGKHVFVEKPLALTVADARRAIEATRSAGVTLQVGQNKRRHPAHRRIKELIDGGSLGTLLHLEGTHTGPAAQKPDLAAWRADPAEDPAGAMAPMGVHVVDTFNYLAGPAKRVAAFSKQVRGWRPLDEATTVIIEYESGPLGYIGTSYFVPAVIALTAYGSEGNAWVEEDGARLFVQKLGEPARSEQPTEVLDTVADELAEFAACIVEGAQPETGGAEGLEVAAVLEAVVESVATGRAVDLARLR
jgi:predicted dehydrogenase